MGLSDEAAKLLDAKRPQNRGGFTERVAEASLSEIEWGEDGRGFGALMFGDHTYAVADYGDKLILNSETKCDLDHNMGFDVVGDGLLCIHCYSAVLLTLLH